MLFLSIDTSMATTNETKPRCCKPGTRSFAMSETLDAKPGFENLTRLALSLKNVLQPVQDLDCIGCLVRLDYHASRGVTHARVVLITHNG